MSFYVYIRLYTTYLFHKEPINQFVSVGIKIYLIFIDIALLSDSDIYYEILKCWALIVLIGYSRRTNIDTPKMENYLYLINYLFFNIALNKLLIISLLIFNIFFLPFFLIALSKVIALPNLWIAIVGRAIATWKNKEEAMNQCKIRIKIKQSWMN